MSWRSLLGDNVYQRLCSGRTVRADLPKLVDAMWAYYKYVRKDLKGFTKEDALIDVLEILDDNGVNFDLDVSEYFSLAE